jgi:hypothetical protein
MQSYLVEAGSPIDDDLLTLRGQFIQITMLRHISLDHELIDDSLLAIVKSHGLADIAEDRDLRSA